MTGTRTEMWSKYTQWHKHKYIYTQAHLPITLKSEVTKTLLQEFLSIFKELLGTQKGLREDAPLYLIVFSQVKQSNTQARSFVLDCSEL